MKKYRVQLYGRHRQIEGSNLSHGLTFRFDLSDENKKSFLEDCISQVGNANPDHKGITIDSVEEYLEEYPDDTRTKLIYKYGKWLE